MNYVPNKYKDMASNYGTVVTKVNGKLSNALDSLNGVGKVLNLQKSNSNDLLTLNVVSGHEEIKGEIKNVKFKLSEYKDFISAKAKELDDIELQEYEEYKKKMEEEQEGEV